MSRDQNFHNGSLTRREAARVVIFGGTAAVLCACGAPNGAPASSAPPATTPVATTIAAGPNPVAATAPTTVLASSAAAPGGTLNVAVADLGTENNDVLVPVVNVASYLIYDPLLRYDEKGNLIPWLAQSSDMSPDGKLWTFNLRKGVKWHNGDEFTSDDVKFSIERYVSDNTTPWSPFHRQTVDRIELPDAYTVKVYAKDPPYVFYPDAITGTGLVPRKYFETVGLEKFKKEPVGTGPWRMTRFTPGASTELEAFKDYWGTARPAWDKLMLLRVPEESTGIAMLKRGEADIVNVSSDNAVELRTEGFQLRQTRTSTIPALFLPGYWMQPGPTTDARVREAMDTAINRQEVVDSFFRGFGQAGGGNMQLTELHWGFDPVWYSVTYDPARAKQLLSDAGYPGKFADPAVRIFSVVQGAANWEPDFLQVISGYWEAVGIQTQIVPMDFTAFRSAWLGKDPKIMGGVAPIVVSGGGSAANSMPSQQNHYTSKGVNLTANDPQLDQDFLAMTTELDINKRLALWKKVQQEAFALHSVLGVCRMFDQYAVSDKVGPWTGLDYLSHGFEVGLTGVQHR
jgi:peptide/nickel transport system substrate-binding protein